MVALAAAAALATAPAAQAARPHVTVTRDGAGIAHVVARDFASLGYGEGYSFAQDNLCTFADDVVTLRAERTKYFGADALSYQYGGGVSDPNWKSDLFWKRIRDQRIVEKAIHGRPPLGLSRRARDLFRGWARGYNAYLRSGRLRDPRCKGKPWVKPITSSDLLLRGEQIATTPSSSQFISGIVDAQPPAPAATAARARAPRPDLAALKAQLGTAESPAGSNGIGIGSRGTRHGTGMVLANPHFPWRGTERFWIAHLKVPGRYDVMGGTIAGFPPVGIGFNRRVAWTSTVSTARRFVVFELQLVPGDPTSYLVDGKPEKMGTQTVTAGGRTHTFYTTRYGLVFNLPTAGYSWSPTTAYALGDVEEANLRAADQYLEMGRARSVEDLVAAEQRYLGIPTFNVIAADRDGRALYSDIGAIPNVTQQKIDTCLSPDPTAKLVLSAARVVTLDGSRSACGLQQDRGAVVKGVLGPSHLPHLIRRDYVENSNDSYWLANPAHPLTGFSPIIGLERTPQNQRTRQGNLMIQALLGRFTIGRLQRMWENDRNYQAELLAKPLAAACAASPTVTLQDGTAVDIGPACPVLAAYRDTGNLDDPGAWLFNEWFRRAPSFTGGQLFSDPFDPDRPLTTPSVLNTANPAVLQALGAAVQNLRANNVPLDATLRQVQHAPQSARIPIHGCFGCFQAITPSDGTPGLQAGPYGEVVYGSSLVMTTELGRRGPHSEGILTYSQATDPTSRWYANLTKLFSRKRWVPMRYGARALRRDRHARRVRIPGASRGAR